MQTFRRKHQVGQQTGPKNEPDTGQPMDGPTEAADNPTAPDCPPAVLGGELDGNKNEPDWGPAVLYHFRGNPEVDTYYGEDGADEVSQNWRTAVYADDINHVDYVGNPVYGLGSPSMVDYTVIESELASTWHLVLGDILLCSKIPVDNVAYINVDDLPTVIVRQLDLNCRAHLGRGTPSEIVSNGSSIAPHRLFAGCDMGGV